MIGIIGLGNFGISLASIYAKETEVIGYTTPEISDYINKNNRHPKLYTEIELSKNLIATNNKHDLDRCGVILLAVPSRSLSNVVEEFNLRNKKIVSLIKGFEKETLLTPIQYLKEKGIYSTAVLSGPSFAKDIIAGKPTGLVCASDDLDLANYLSELLSKISIRVYSSNDPLGVELGGILKNVIAVAAGISDELGFGDSTRAMIVTRGLKEISNVAVRLGAKHETLFGLSGLGDLLLTSTSEQSRNRKFGVLLAKGNSVDEANIKIGSTVESIQTIPLIQKIAKEHNFEVPICDAIYKVITNQIKVNDLYPLLFSRPKKPE